MFQRNLKGRYLFALFNFQDAVLRFALLRNTFIISHSEDFVKYFFKFFKIFFRDLRCSLADQLFYYITFSSVCQALFSSFLKNFSEVIRRTLAVQLLYYITYRPVCQVLFRLFLKISANLSFRSPKTFPFFAAVLGLSSDSFIIIPPFFDIVKQKIRC